MSRAALLLFAAPLMLACTKKEAPSADTSAMAAATDTMAAAPAPVSYAGNWSVQVMPDAKDTVLLTYVLNSTNDKTGWKMTLPGRQPMDVRVLSMDNDSVVVENGPYSSALRKNVMVTTHSSMHMEGDKLTGMTQAHYATKNADSVVVLRAVGTKQ